MSATTTALNAAGVLFCFSVAAVFNERAYSSKDFHYPWTTVTLEFSFYCLMSFLRHQCCNHFSNVTTTTTNDDDDDDNDDINNPLSPWLYVLSGALKVLGHGLPLMSLTLLSQPVDYVTYTLIKSSKVVVAAYVNRLFYGRSPPGEVAGSIVVTIGLLLWNHDTLFRISSSSSGNIASMKAVGSARDVLVGASGQQLGVGLLLLGSLVSSINSILQHYVLKRYRIPASSLMAKQYVVASSLSCFIVFFLSGEKWHGLHWFQQAEWSVLRNFVGDECMSYLGLMFIMALTKHSGSVVTHSICNVRRMITVLLSWGFNIAGGASGRGRERTYVHGVAAILVFAGVWHLEQSQRTGGVSRGVKEE
jgi:hypothetical protein